MSAARRILLPLPIVVALPLAQAALVLPSATPALDVGFVALALLSFAATVVAAWLLATGVWAATSSTPWRLRLRALVWTLALAVVVAICAVLNPLLAVPALVLAAFVLPAAAAGDARDGLRVFRRHPGRNIALAAGCLVLVVLGWLVALMTGLFVTGALAALLCWFGFALAGTIALTAGSALLRRG